MIVRAAMMGWRWGIDRMTWFFYANDVNGSSLYSRSGLTGSKNGSFQKKTIFTAFEAPLYNIEDLYFLDVLQEDSAAWVYVLGDSLGNETHLMAWRPIQGDDTNLTNIPLTSVYMPISAVKLEGLSAVGETIATPSYNNGTMNLSLGTVPILVSIQKTTDLATNISNPSLIISPNPAEKKCLVQCSEAIEQLIIWDNLGRKVYENVGNPQTHTLNIETVSFSQGLYICEVITAKQRHLSQKIWVR